MSIYGLIIEDEPISQFKKCHKIMFIKVFIYIIFLYMDINFILSSDSLYPYLYLFKLFLYHGNSIEKS